MVRWDQIQWYHWVVLACGVAFLPWDWVLLALVCFLLPMHHPRE